MTVHNIRCQYILQGTWDNIIQTQFPPQQSIFPFPRFFHFNNHFRICVCFHSTPDSSREWEKLLLFLRFLPVVGLLLLVAITAMMMGSSGGDQRSHICIYTTLEQMHRCKSIANSTAITSVSSGAPYGPNYTKGQSHTFISVFKWLSLLLAHGFEQPNLNLLHPTDQAISSTSTILPLCSHELHTYIVVGHAAGRTLSVQQKETLRSESFFLHFPSKAARRRLM